MNNRLQLNIILAKFWDSFKQKNPETATLITIIGMGLVGVFLFAQELGLEIPSNINKILITLTSLYLSFNNPSTYQTLNPQTNINNEN
jgi:uncharacterized membrane protein